MLVDKPPIGMIEPVNFNDASIHFKTNNQRSVEYSFRFADRKPLAVPFVAVERSKTVVVASGIVCQLDEKSLY